MTAARALAWTLRSLPCLPGCEEGSSGRRAPRRGRRARWRYALLPGTITTGGRSWSRRRRRGCGRIPHFGSRHGSGRWRRDAALRHEGGGHGLEAWVLDSSPESSISRRRPVRTPASSTGGLAALFSWGGEGKRRRGCGVYMGMERRSNPAKNAADLSSDRWRIRRRKFRLEVDDDDVSDDVIQ